MKYLSPKIQWGYDPTLQRQGFFATKLESTFPGVTAGHRGQIQMTGLKL